MKILTILAIAGGVLVRLIIYLQNRNLLLDEANVARNLFERGFGGLAKPLSYEQYAPPVFLWIEKLNVVLFGFGEYALRLYPLLAGVASVFVMHALLKRLMPTRALWFPLLLFVSTHMLIRYSSEVKQYMPDVFISLSLLLMALRMDIGKYSTTKFATTWFLIGSLAIWSCMPSVFVLAGVGCFYGWISFSRKEYKRLVAVIVTAILWLVQFGFYYMAVLKPQANSDYLQNFHQNDFLFATPDNAGEWMHNWAVFNALLKLMGKWPLMLTVYMALVITGAVSLIRNNIAKAFLLCVPIGGLLVAAALNQYSLMPRVALFSVPLFMLLIGVGFEAALRINVREWKLAMVVLGVYCIAGDISKSITTPYKYEQLTEGLNYTVQQGIRGHDVYLHHSSVPAFIYYTEMHPNRDRYRDLIGANRLGWDTYYPLLGFELKNKQPADRPVALLFTNATYTQSAAYAEQVRRYVPEIGRLEKDYIKVFVFGKKKKATVQRGE
ncbi:hypothetical protein [Polluticoccus soli]|uniref:hypothetical protein n=1 Tax=Polluticoccus soli TaxID=3034150 RepID=UPI0023E323C7|nr:hypothetical protein [Flavipsychrobacter sp. JY13-12]